MTSAADTSREPPKKPPSTSTLTTLLAVLAVLSAILSPVFYVLGREDGLKLPPPLDTRTELVRCFDDHYLECKGKRFVSEWEQCRDTAERVCATRQSFAERP